MPQSNDRPAAPNGKRRTGLWDNRLFLMFVSLVCGVAAWLIVTMFIDQQGYRTISGVTINYEYSASTYTNLGLDMVERPEIDKATVRVEGSNTEIGNMESSDIMVYPSYSGVRGTGETTLRLQARLTNTSDFSSDVKLTVETPTSITVVFDQVGEKTVPVTVDTSDLVVAEGYVLNKSAAVPSEVTLRGPTSELDLISSVVAPVSAEGELSDSAAVSAVLELRDEDGVVLEPEYTTLDSETVNVTLTVYQVRELPLTVDFINTPTGFDTSSLVYSLSQETLSVAGPARTVGSLESLAVTSFDLSREFELGRDYQRLIELPAGLVSTDGVTNVTLSFDTSEMGETTLNISNIKAVNIPSSYDIEILSSMVSGVTLYGPADEVATLTADSVVAQIDCQSLTLTAGQQTIPVTIQIPSSSRIFATGTYTVQCEVTAK